MPLEHSASKEALKRNMRTLYGDIGKSPHVQSRKQAVAIALSTQRRAEGRAFGGGIDPTQALGVAGTMGQMMPSGPGGAPAGTNPAVPPPQAGGMGVSLPSPGSTATPNMAGMAQPYGVGNLPGFGTMAPPPVTTASPFAAGGGIGADKSPNLSTPWQTKQEVRQMHTGPVLSAVPGRTDAHAVKVPNGSYVVAADLISGRGQGNTLAGMNFWQKRFNMGPFGTSAGSIHRGPGAPRMPHMAAGGHAGDGGAAVPVNIAGGELVITPEKVIEFAMKHLGKKVSLETAHRFLDALMVEERKRLIKQLKALPGPVKS